MLGYSRKEMIDKEFYVFYPANEDYQNIEQNISNNSRLGFSTTETRLSLKTVK